MKPDERERLHAMLAEDTGSIDEADDLLPMMQALKRWPAPPIHESEISQLLSALQPEMPETGWRRLWRTLGSSHTLLILRAQIRVISREIWLASALVILLGTLVTLISYDSQADNFTPLVFLAPVVTAIGVSLLYDAEQEPIFELEDSTPPGLSLLLLARMTLIFSFDLALALVGSVILALAHTEISLFPLIMAWLLPMTFLSALAYFLSIVSRNAVFSMAFSLIIWGMHVAFTPAASESGLLYMLSLPGLTDPNMRPVLFTLSALLVGLASQFLQNADQRMESSQ